MEAAGGDFLGSGVDLLVVIAVEFVIKDSLGLFDFLDVFADTGSDDAVLEPAVRSFHFAFGLGGKGIGDFYVAIIQDLFPLGSGFIGEEVVFSPEGISSLDEAEDGVGINIVGIR